MNVTPQKHQPRGPSHAEGEEKASLVSQNQPTPAKDEENAGPLKRSDAGSESDQSQAKDGGDASILPRSVQEKLPENVERAIPNAIHDTGDKK